MGNKFHPQCFVCTYCRKVSKFCFLSLVFSFNAMFVLILQNKPDSLYQEFKDRKYKTDPRDFKPYCFDCFEKLLGHYGDAHYG